jgi:hypothetical protein
LLGVGVEGLGVAAGFAAEVDVPAPQDARSKELRSSAGRRMRCVSPRAEPLMMYVESKFRDGVAQPLRTQSEAGRNSREEDSQKIREKKI